MQMLRYRGVAESAKSNFEPNGDVGMMKATTLVVAGTALLSLTAPAAAADLGGPPPQHYDYDSYETARQSNWTGGYYAGRDFARDVSQTAYDTEQ